MRGLFLDDYRWPADVTWVKYPENVKWTIARTQYDFMWLLEDEEFDIITFDHDLECYDEEGKEVTGYDLLKFALEYFYENKKEIPIICFHTKNPVGEENMKNYYQNFMDFYMEEQEK